MTSTLTDVMDALLALQRPASLEQVAHRARVSQETAGQVVSALEQDGWLLPQCTSRGELRYACLFTEVTQAFWAQVVDSCPVRALICQQITGSGNYVTAWDTLSARLETDESGEPHWCVSHRLLPPEGTELTGKDLAGRVSDGPLPLDRLYLYGGQTAGRLLGLSSVNELPQETEHIVLGPAIATWATWARQRYAFPKAPQKGNQ